MKSTSKLSKSAFFQRFPSTFHLPPNPRSKIPNPHILPIPPLRSSVKRNEGAFSLTEVVIALGVATVAFTSILALFPLGLDMSKESYEQTQAALIAQSILGDLRDVQGGNPGWNTTLTGLGVGGNQLPSGHRLLLIKSGAQPSEFNANNYTNIQVRNSSVGNAIQVIFLRYDLILTNSLLPLRPNGTIGGSQYTNGISTGTNPAALVMVELNPMLAAADRPGAGSPYLHSVRVSVETPGNVPMAKRKAFVFGGLIR